MLSKRDKKVSSKDKAMSDTLRAQQLFLEAYPDVRYSSVKELYRDAYGFLSRRMTKSLTYRRVRAIREGKARRIDGDEMDALRLAVIEEGRNEARKLRARLASLDEKIAAFEAAAHREAVAGSVPQVGRQG